ncbi:MAG: hypothetical protein IPJ65_03125 [Archangiaceae bacterium]|nr:hypothetical protein [Archangiaceae bacterium]
MDPYSAVVSVLVVGMLFGMPLFALSLRFAIKPVLEAWQKAREAAAPKPVSSKELEALKLRVAALEAVWENRLGGGALQPVSPSKQLVD